MCSGLTHVVLCHRPWLCSLRKVSLQNLLCGHVRSRTSQLSQQLPSGAGLEPRVCLRNETGTVLLRPDLWFLWQCKSLFGFASIFIQSVLRASEHMKNLV